MRIIKYTILLMLLTLFTHTSSYQVNAYGVGWCHSFGGSNNPKVKYIYPAGEFAWKALEPSEGKYDFSAIDNMIEKARSAKKKLHIQLYGSNPDAKYNKFVLIPQWAIDKGMRVHYVEDNEGNKYPASPIQWDPIYLDLHEKLIKAFAAKYEKPEYYDVIEAVVMQSGGNWGEMTLPAKNGAETGEKADALDPNNFFVKEMARVFLGSENKSGEIAKQDSAGNWVFDNYYIKSVQNIIDIYARSLSHYPFALQLGFSLTGQRRVATEAIEYGLSKYGSHMWIRYAWWGSFGAGDSNPNAQDYWGRYQDRTVTVAEVGHPAWWCAAEGGYTKGGCYECCQWDTKAEAIVHNQNFINTAINSGIIATCMQGNIIEDTNKYPVDFTDLQKRIDENVNKKASLLNITPLPTSQTTPTLIPIPTINPDVNNDGKITLMDYYYVVYAKAGGVVNSLINPDVNTDGKIDQKDLDAIISVLIK